MSSAKRSPSKQGPKYVWVNLTNTHYMSVHQCCEEMGFKPTESETKNMLLWCDYGGTLDVASGLRPWQFYNHFPGIWSIARKVELARNFERISRAMNLTCLDFHPKSFLIPSQFADLKTYMMSIPKKSDRTFIVKPDKGSQGRGIILVQDPNDLDEYFDMAVAQQYITPYLIDGYKFDLRIYALVTSVDPLRIYIYREGMARFCTEKYVKPKTSNLDQVYSHLTNYSLNKKNENFHQPENADNADDGSKRSLSSVYKIIESNGGDVNKIQHGIEDIIRLTLASVQSFLANNYHTAISCKDEKSRCFEILGFDVMLDSNLKPWLLEVNCMPSLACDSPFDESLKMGVISGTLKILNLNPNFRKQVMARQKAATQVRISGATKIKMPILFDPKVESEIAKTTKWKQIYPFEHSDGENAESNEISEDEKVMNNLLIKQREFPVGAAAETAASRARKEAILEKMKNIENKSAGKPAKPNVEKRKLTKAYSEVANKQKAKPLPRVANIQPKLLKRQVEQQQRMANHKPKTLINEYSELPANIIDENEERDRVKLLRRQSCLLNSVSLTNMINDIIESINSPSQSSSKRTNQNQNINNQQSPINPSGKSQYAPQQQSNLLSHNLIQPPSLVQIHINQNPSKRLERNQQWDNHYLFPLKKK